MSNEEIALKLVECTMNNNTDATVFISKKDVVDMYFNYLENIQNHESNTIIGKINKLIDEFDSNWNGRTIFDECVLIHNIKEILKNNGGECK